MVFEKWYSPNLVQEPSMQCISINYIIFSFRPRVRSLNVCSERVPCHVVVLPGYTPLCRFPNKFFLQTPWCGRTKIQAEQLTRESVCRKSCSSSPEGCAVHAELCFKGLFACDCHTNTRLLSFWVLTVTVLHYNR